MVYKAGSYAKTLIAPPCRTDCEGDVFEQSQRRRRKNCCQTYAFIQHGLLSLKGEPYNANNAALRTVLYKHDLGKQQTWAGLNTGSNESLKPIVAALVTL